MKALIIFFCICLFIGCSDNNISPQNVVNATHIPIDPFKYSVGDWALKMQNYFKYETLLSSYKYKNYYFAIFRDGEILHVLSVSTDEWGSNASFSNSSITGKDGAYITDYKKTQEYFNKQNNSEKPFYTYDAKYDFRSSSFVINKSYLNQVVYAEVQILSPPKYTQSKDEVFKTQFVLK